MIHSELEATMFCRTVESLCGDLPRLVAVIAIVVVRRKSLTVNRTLPYSFIHSFIRLRT